MEDNHEIASGRKKARKDWVVKHKDLNQFLDDMTEFENDLLDIESSLIEQKNFIYHDFKTSLGIFFSCTQGIINNLPGETFEAKLENSDTIYRDLYNSLELITSQLGMIDVIINPKSISFGVKKKISMHSLFQKMVKLFKHSKMVKNKELNIILNAECWISETLCYESIEFLPLILLENAIKYSTKETEIEVKLEQKNNIVKVLVKSIGPLVPDQRKDEIFKKFYRDDSAQNFSKNGIGMGLWIAQQILKAHGSVIIYHKNTHENIKIGLNIFEFNLPINN